MGGKRHKLQEWMLVSILERRLFSRGPVNRLFFFNAFFDSMSGPA